MITWFYSKFAIYVFSILVFFALLAILYDFLASQTFLKNVMFSKFLMFQYYVRYADQSDLVARNASYSFLISMPLSPSNVLVTCKETLCVTRWSYMGTPGKIEFTIPYYYARNTTVYYPKQSQLELQIK